MFNFALDSTNKRSVVAKILFKKRFKLGPEQYFYMTLMFILVLVKTDLLIKKKSKNSIHFDPILLAILNLSFYF